MSRRARKKIVLSKAWTPLGKGPINPALVDTLRRTGVPEAELPFEAWANDVYQVTVRRLGDWTHLSIKRHDRRVVRDWRHLQAIKNEVVGSERWAMELYPPESRLIDTSNEYHLFVSPAGSEPPVSYGDGRAVLDSSTANEDRVAGAGKARQRPFQPGLPTGSGVQAMTRDDLAEAWESIGGKP